MTPPASIPADIASGRSSSSQSNGAPASPFPGFPLPFPFPPAGGGFPFPTPQPSAIPALFAGGLLNPSAEDSLGALLGRSASIEAQMEAAASRDALRFMLSSDGAIFREFLLDEVKTPSCCCKLLIPCHDYLIAALRITASHDAESPRMRM